MGKITTMNFYKVSGSAVGTNVQNSGLENAFQALNTCIRRDKGMCCIQYQLCIKDTQGITLTDTTGGGTANNGLDGEYNAAFSIDVDITPFIIDTTESNAGLVDALCSTDYIEIPSSWSGPCGGGTGAARPTVNSRYCGSKFGANIGYVQDVATIADITSGAVCDCSEPFVVRHSSDSLDDEGGETSVNGNDNTLVTGRGACLDYVQQPCYY
jgi:hypothetical protein